LSHCSCSSMPSAMVSSRRVLASLMIARANADSSLVLAMPSMNGLGILRMSIGSCWR
jgi:hypothetical protein